MRQPPSAIAWARGLAAIMPATDRGSPDLHVDDGEDRVRSAYGPEKYERLVELDPVRPDQPLQLNQNIRPTAQRDRLLRSPASSAPWRRDCLRRLTFTRRCADGSGDATRRRPRHTMARSQFGCGRAEEVVAVEPGRSEATSEPSVGSLPTARRALRRHDRHDGPRGECDDGQPSDRAGPRLQPSRRSSERTSAGTPPRAKASGRARCSRGSRAARTPCVRSSSMSARTGAPVCRTSAPSQSWWTAASSVSRGSPAT